MGAISVWHWVIVLAIVVILFGKGRISGLMGDLGKGLGAFKRELKQTATKSPDDTNSDSP
ncbi:twin-arginine translocase TatA/TatE family subunit [Mesorhizobium sp. WSM1497]|uniref:twin-arginine translocase TatA/TatE family subunit n=1 Tax=Mesorhizobium sp. WSM1497 TaxID=278153 RepID=UPI000A005B66|nr:twin-arginine translocase TatA/TatE family subunit [Mesorhizobium sp. WSM1497]ARP64329.1 twin-arginine translocase TatA/TatE family subunit [Mesorhizobium sp. WSM1497]